MKFINPYDDCERYDQVLFTTRQTHDIKNMSMMVLQRDTYRKRSRYLVKSLRVLAYAYTFFKLSL